MALLMLNTIKTTRLLNVFYTEIYNKTWNVKWYPLTTMQIEASVSQWKPRWWFLSWLTVEQAPWQMQMCANRLWTSITFPSVAPSQIHTCALPAEKGEIALCCLSLNTRLRHRNYSADDQPTMSLFTVEHFDQELSSEIRKTERHETTDKQSWRVPNQWMENCNKEQNEQSQIRHIG